jgi:TolB-like protein/tetratricopeptide (TPR) repeat protein
MSGDPENEYFSDGLSEELLNALVKLGGLQVTGRTSSFAFKGQNQDLREIGRLLNVSSVLEGSVRKAGNRVRITAQLIKASDGYHLWSDSFDRELDDIFSIQAEIAGQVSKALHLTLLGGDEPAQAITVPASENAEAYEEYLRGMYVLQRNPDNEAGLEQAKNHFTAALEIDPAYVDANWGLFLVWDRSNRNGFIPYQESIEIMKTYATELERLAPDSEHALIAVARIATNNYDYRRAAEYLTEAARLYPGSAGIQTAYASALLLANPVNRPGSSADARNEAAQAIENSIRLDPLSLGALRFKALWLLQQGDCSELEKTLKRALDLEPEAGRFHYGLATCIYAYEGDVNRALTIIEQEPLQYARNSLLAILHHKLGNQDLAQQYLDELYLENSDAASYQYGQIHAQWGEMETALIWLENALKIRDPGIILSIWDPLLDPLRSEPEFQKILEAAGYR